nr:MAG: hypothetical protein [Sanya narnavirus 1]UHR49908.1 MAG: hypothetical protein [Sanya narnavirus 1]UHR49910.1 MAG: hypothetical protein [Sanya narnavirus 1]UHR49912.1 MAG: hypothetical protein [Sanya narnavirus 1]UHR49919.1 MAG: hypothetical protein [Sanya narnavirus 1]
MDPTDDAVRDLCALRWVLIRPLAVPSAQPPQYRAFCVHVERALHGHVVQDSDGVNILTWRAKIVRERDLVRLASGHIFNPDSLLCKHAAHPRHDSLVTVDLESDAGHRPEVIYRGREHAEEIITSDYVGRKLMARGSNRELMKETQRHKAERGTHLNPPFAPHHFSIRIGHLHRGEHLYDVISNPTGCLKRLQETRPQRLSVHVGDVICRVRQIGRNYRPLAVESPAYHSQKLLAPRILVKVEIRITGDYRPELAPDDISRHQGNSRELAEHTGLIARLRDRKDRDPVKGHLFIRVDRRLDDEFVHVRLIGVLLIIDVPGPSHHGPRVVQKFLDSAAPLDGIIAGCSSLRRVEANFLLQVFFAVHHVLFCEGIDLIGNLLRRSRWGPCYHSSMALQGLSHRHSIPNWEHTSKARNLRADSGMRAQRPDPQLWHPGNSINQGRLCICGRPQAVLKGEPLKEAAALSPPCRGCRTPDNPTRQNLCGDETLKWSGMHCLNDGGQCIPNSLGVLESTPPFHSRQGRSRIGNPGSSPNNTGVNRPRQNAHG